jgi:hypothetical protein
VPGFWGSLAITCNATASLRSVSLLSLSWVNQKITPHGSRILSRILIFAGIAGIKPTPTCLSSATTVPAHLGLCTSVAACHIFPSSGAQKASKLGRSRVHLGRRPHCWPRLDRPLSSVATHDPVVSRNGRIPLPILLLRFPVSSITLPFASSDHPPPPLGLDCRAYRLYQQTRLASAFAPVFVYVFCCSLPRCCCTRVSNFVSTDTLILIYSSCRIIQIDSSSSLPIADLPPPSSGSSVFWPHMKPRK